MVLPGVIGLDVCLFGVGVSRVTLSVPVSPDCVIEVQVYGPLITSRCRLLVSEFWFIIDVKFSPHSFCLVDSVGKISSIDSINGETWKKKACFAKRI